jgi:transposase
MSERELRRVGILARVKSGELKVADAARMLFVSYRQAKRLWRRYRDEGAAGLKHGSAGRTSHRAKPKKVRERSLRLVRKKYSGAEGERFGPTLAAEHLASEDKLVVHPETLRRWMLAEGLWSPARRRRAHRQRRERRAHFGELVQMDGSFHAWFEDRGPEGCLMNMVDDATSTTLGRIGKEETIWTAVGVLRRWVENYGVPLALYTDWKTVYVKEPTEQQLLRGDVAKTQFGQMCARLGTRIIAANSAQAKGRVERNHGTHQDRLVKKLRRKKIKTYAAANEFLEKEYLPEHNQRFRHVAAAEQDYHRPAPKPKELDEIFRLETERVIGNDWVVRYENRYLQVQTSGRRQAPAKAKVVVCEWEDGRLEIRYRGQKLQWEELADKPEPRRETSAEKKSKPYGGTPPTAQHPWKQSYQEMKVWNSPAEKAARV